MARRKAARKPRGQPARKSVQAPKFPADRLPPELIHMVFAYLEPKEAAAFRWVGRVSAEIGLQYLTPKIHLELREESYDQLLAIAKHPIASKYVVELQYDTEGLKLIDRARFDRYLKCRGGITQRHASSEMPDELSSARAWRAYERESSRNQRKTAQLLDQAWSKYEEYQTSHKKVEQAGFFRGKMAEAFKRLPNLKMISTSTTSVYGQYVAEIRKLLPTYYFAAGNGVSSNNRGVTKSVLLAAASAGLQMNHFCCQRFSWQTLTQDITDVPVLKRSMLHLKTLNITFAEGHQTHRLTPFEGGPMRALVQSFITSAPNLEYLTLSIKSSIWSNGSSDGYLVVKDTIGNFHWSSLKSLSLDGLVSTEHDLVHLCERHAQTLRDFSLRDMYMYSGSLYATFHRIRQAFRLGQQLDVCKIRGSFEDQRRFCWLGKTDQRSGKTLGTLISDYIQAIDVGDITFDDYHELVGRN